MKDYAKYLQSPEWLKRRDDVLKRADFRCEFDNVYRPNGRCSCQADDVHHLTYARVGNEDLSDLKALCRSHHEEAHGLRRKPTRYKNIYGAPGGSGKYW